MPRPLSPFVLVASFLLALPLVSQAPASRNGSEGDRDLRSVEQLLAMERDERRAYLESLDPAERRGLWFEVKKAERRSAGRAAAMEPLDILADSPYRSGGQQRDIAVSATATRAIGTIQYDDNVGGTTFGGGAIIGNRFDTHTGIPVLNPGTVSTVQAVVAQGPAFTTSSAGFVLLGPQTTGGGAMALFSTFTNTPTGTTDTVTFAGIGASYTGSSFFVLFGDFDSVYVPVFGTGSTLGQGHHGVVGYTGGMGPNITGTFDFGDTLNALVRSTGNIVPVELMSYSVE